MAESQSQMLFKETLARETAAMGFRSYSSYADLNRLEKVDFPRFNGGKITDWLFMIEQFFLIDRTPEELKVGLASIHFDDIVATLHQSIVQSMWWKHVRHDWWSYKLMLQVKYNQLMDDSIAKLKQLQEVDGIDEYHARFELISTRVNLSEAFLVSAYLTGLQIDTQINVRMFRPQSIQQCLMLGRLYEKAHQKKLIIRKDGDDYRKGVMPLNVSSNVAGTSMSNDGICMIDNDEDRFLSGSDFVENEVEEMKKYLVEIDGEMSSDGDQISDAREVFVFNVEECLGNIHVPNALHKDRECFEGKHSIQQENFVGMENFLQQEELNCDKKFVSQNIEKCCGNKGEVKGCLECVSQPQKVSSTFEKFAKADATMNQLLSPIGFVVNDLQSGGGSDIVCVQTFASPVVVGDFQETPWILNAESKDIPSCHIAIDEGSDTYACQELDGILLRNHTIHQQKKPSKNPKSWNFKFKTNSEDIKSRYTKVWCEKATRSLQKKLQYGKSWKFQYKNRGIQSELVIMEKIEVDKKYVEMLRRCNSGQTIGAYGSEIKRWDIHIRVWDPGGSNFRNFSFKLKLWFWLSGQTWMKKRLHGSYSMN